MNKILKLFLLLIFSAVPAMAANDVYITQTGAGGQTGVDCANAKPLSYFNTGGNWSGSPTGIQIGPDTTVHLCAGTYTFSGGTNNAVAFQGNGTSGHPVTLVADQGAVNITAPWWGSGSAGQAVMNVNGHSFVTVDGRSQLTIQATANGTLLAHQVNGASGVRSDGGANVTIENLIIANIYVHACTLIVNADPAINCTDTVGDSTGGISGSGNNLLIQGNVMHDAKNGVGLNYSGGSSLSNEQVIGNEIYRIDHGIEIGVTNAGSTITGTYSAYNYIHDFQNWDTSVSLNTFHHDGHHIFTNSGGALVDTYVYGNKVTGDFGFNFNSAFFSEPGPTGALDYFANIINDQSSVSHPGCGMLCQQVPNTKVYYNTIIQSGASQNDALNFYSTGIDIVGNIIIHPASAAHPESGSSITRWDWNTYYNIGSQGWNFGTFSGWQGAGHDTNGQNGNNPNLNVNYFPNAGSPVVAFGLNLNGTCTGQPNPGIGALCVDQAGAPRPTIGLWDGGALQLFSSTDVYISQSGGGSGASCGSTLSAAYFNNASNWSATPTGFQIGPGSRVHLCGTISSALTAQAAGSTLHPVTIFFETGSKLSQAAATGNFLSLGSFSHFVVDGNSTGVIENTANGTLLANKVNGAKGINYAGSSDVNIKHVTIQNLYVRAQNDATNSIDATTINCIFGGGGPVGGTSSNITIDGITCHDAGWGLYTRNGISDSNLEIKNSTFFNVDHGIAITASANGNSLSTFFIHDNHIYSYANWDSGTAYHHDGFHTFCSASSCTSTMSGLSLYNNLFEGPVGTSVTAHVFIEGLGGSVSNLSAANIFNNVYKTDSNANLNNGMLGFFSCTASPCSVYNETYLGASNGAGLGLSIANMAALKQKNIASNSFSTMAAFTNNTYGAGDVDRNVYANTTGSNQFKFNGAFKATFALWQTAANADLNGLNPVTSGLDVNGVPQAGSAVVGAGTNLFSICNGQPNPGLGALCRDKNGVARPSSGAWDAGAYNFTGALPTVAPPTGVTATPH